MPIVRLYKHEEDALKFLWANRKYKPEYFDFPDYGGLPECLSNKLDSRFVDVIQELWFTKHRTYKQYKKEVLSYYK